MDRVRSGRGDRLNRPRAKNYQYYGEDRFWPCLEEEK